MEEVINLDSDNESKQEELKSKDEIIIKNRYSITIRKSDYDRLDQGTYLNDNLIDFFLNHFTADNKKYFVFNSFFYSTLTENSFEKVHKWFKSTDLFKFKYWIIPIAQNEHWILVIVTKPKHAFTFVNSETKIILFDSLDSRYFNPQRDIECFMREEWNARYEEDVQIRLPIYFLSLPLQNNSYDCGVFLVKYAQEFISNPNKFEDLDSDFSDLFSQAEISKHRYYLKSMILDIRDNINTLKPCYKICAYIPINLVKAYSEEQEEDLEPCSKKKKIDKAHTKLLGF